MSQLNINFGKLIASLLITFRRRRVSFDYLYALYAPIKTLYNDFRKFKTDAVYRVTHNSQVFSIENVLNDKFDNQLRRIYITDSYAAEKNYIYRRSEAKPKYIYKRLEDKPKFYIHRRFYFSPDDTDFIIVLPAAIKPVDSTGLNIITNQIIEQVNYYKLASKRFQIIWI